MSKLDEKVTIKQAYFAMFEYLRGYYERGESDEVGAILGGLSLLQGGGSADPAALSDFLTSMDAVLKAEGGGGYHAADFKCS